LSTDVNMQLRFPFGAPSQPQVWRVKLSGLQLVITPEDANVNLVLSYLQSIGVTGELEPSRGVLTTVNLFSHFLNLPAQVTVVPAQPLDVLWELLNNPPVGSAPVMLSADTSEILNLNWPSETFEYNESFPMQNAHALLALGVSLVAHPRAWDLLVRSTHIPISLARASLNLDNFVELSTPAPDRLEMAPLRGLFRIDGNRFGVPLAYSQDLNNTQGIIWDHTPFEPEQPPSVMPDLPFPLSSHAEEDLRSLVGNLSNFKGQAVVWDQGLGRRIFCLAALESLQAYPLLVVTSPSNIWLWHRHLNLIGRNPALSSLDADVRLATYSFLSSPKKLPNFASVIFDDLDRNLTQNTSEVLTVSQLPCINDAYRIACANNVPSQSEALSAFMSVIRPVEFRADIPVMLRYPGESENRLREHAKCFIASRSAQNTNAAHFFRSSSTVELSAPQSLLDESKLLIRDMTDPQEMITAQKELFSSGSSSVLGPKVAHAFSMVNSAKSARKRIVVLTAFESTANRLATLIGSNDVERTANTPPSAQIAIVQYNRKPPPVTDYDTVVFMEYPLSLQEINYAAGFASDTTGPSETVVLHLKDSLDDRLAVISSLRFENKQQRDPLGDFSTEEAEYLLSLSNI